MKTVQIPITLYVEYNAEDLKVQPSPEAIAKEIERHLAEWEDGRYSFSSELVREGLRGVAANAIYNTAVEALEAAYPFAGHLVPTGRGSRGRVSAIVMERVRLHVHVASRNERFREDHENDHYNVIEED